MIKKTVNYANPILRLEGLECPELIVLQNFTKDVSIKAHIQRVGQDDQKITTKIPILVHHEATQKIFKSVFNKSIVTASSPQYSPTNPENEWLVPFAIVQFCLDGEIILNNDDIISLEFDGILDNDTDIDVFIKGSNIKSNNILSFLNENYDSKNDEKRLDVSKYSFLIFENNPLKCPQIIERFYEVETKRDNFEELQILQKINFGLKHSSNELNDSSIVIDVRGLQTLLLKDDRSIDFKFHGVKIN